ncbi:recombinase family protein, partial [Microbacterium sp.]|uniref:recombinase family protein n=1 Tax=Microbacterium sp. TaxID=51671 RepID=UPI003A83B5E9
MSTRGQKADSQVARLEAAGCERIFVDVGYSSRLEDRPEWNECQKIQRSGDRLTIPALDRVAGTDTIAIAVMRDHAER